MSRRVVDGRAGHVLGPSDRWRWLALVAQVILVTALVGDFDFAANYAVRLRWEPLSVQKMAYNIFFKSDSNKMYLIIHISRNQNG